MPRRPLAAARAALRHRLVTAAAEGTDARLAALERAVAQLSARSAEQHAAVLAHLEAWERRQRRDVMTAMEQQAAISTAEFVHAAMGHVERFVHPHDTLRHALSCVDADGTALEFGVATGTTLGIIAAHHRRGPVFGFDSFQGLPERWRLGFDAGEFGDLPVPEVDGAELVVGWFDDTLPGFLSEHPGPVAFLHCDADLYSSTRTVLEQVGPRLVPGSVVVFDEYFNYAGWQDHEHRAWTEHVERTGLSWRYLGMTMDDEQVSVLVTG